MSNLKATITINFYPDTVDNETFSKITKEVRNLTKLRTGIIQDVKGTYQEVCYVGYNN